MATQAGADVYGRRKLIERINANLKNHGFGFIPVRGLIKATAVALWHALANNLLAAHRLRSRPRDQRSTERASEVTASTRPAHQTPPDTGSGSGNQPLLSSIPSQARKQGPIRRGPNDETQ